MEQKKSRKANLESRGGTHLLLGMVISLALVWSAFEYKSYDKLGELNINTHIFAEEDDFMVQTERPKEIKPPLVRPISVIEIVDNTVDVPDIDINVEIDPDDELDDFIIIEDEPIDYDEVKIFVIVEDEPEYPGGEVALMQHLAKIKYPLMAKEAGTQGIVYVSFLIEKDGSVRQASILRGIGNGCDEETLRIINEMPNWIPGKQLGRAVRVRVKIPVRFVLGDN